MALYVTDLVSVIKIGLKKFYLYLVVDNYSRRQLSWRLRDRLCKHELLATVKDAYGFGLKHLKELNVQLWVDGGSENNNAVVDEFIQRSQVGMHKVIAQKDVGFSNSMIEAVFKVIKYQYIYPHDPDAREKLRSLLAFAFHEYDTMRPHGSIGGLTPDESYRGLQPDREKEKLHLNAARTERIDYNLKNQCGKCTVLELWE
jgi:transposase InsO family protein